ARVSLEAEEKHIAKSKPEWVDIADELEYEPKPQPPTIPGGWPNVDAKSGPLKGAYKTFHDMAPETIPPGETLYRVVDPGDNSYDNGVFWMREADFKALQREAPHSKAAWRRK